ncbi:MAG: Nucleotidyltransferase domain protein [Chloroflexi bacterium ADurb.Bin325]|nr:MAG: Nucleotidyltransferase domain protein [Chloroflexi bacterium ADurb.Bin325]
MVKTKREILRRLTQFQRERGAEFGVQRIGVFGSAAQDRLTRQSDIDIVVELVEPDLFLLIGLQQELAEVFGRQVDVVHYRPTMNPVLKRHIDQEAVYAG